MAFVENQNEINLTCPAQTLYLSAIRAFVNEITEKMGFAKEDLDKIEICVDEACANAIEHAYKENKKESIIDVSLLLNPDALTITICDFGKGSQFGFHGGIKSIEDYKKKEVPRGLGLYIINNFMDEVNFSFPENKGTQISMKKYLPEKLLDA